MPCGDEEAGHQEAGDHGGGQSRDWGSGGRIASSPHRRAKAEALWVFLGDRSSISHSPTVYVDVWCSGTKPKGSLNYFPAQVLRLCQKQPVDSKTTAFSTQASPYALRNSSLDMPDCVSMVRNVEPLILRWLGIVSGIPGPIRILPYHRNVLAFPCETKSQALKSLDDLPDGSIHWELGCQMATAASATKASKTAGSPSNTSAPKVSM